MQKIEALHGFDKIKILADNNRLRILRLLMADSLTLSELGSILGKTPAWIRHHIKILENSGLVELVEERQTGKVRETFYGARQSAILLQELILPNSGKPILLFSGSHDTALEQISTTLTRHLKMLNLPVGSLDGLVNLRQGLCHIAGSHLLDRDGEYNVPFVKRLFPDRAIQMFTLAYRTQGLFVLPGNPKKITGIEDLCRSDLTFINRNPGSGTRLWIDKKLEELGIPVEAINGYGKFVATHSDSADSVENGFADIALGIQAAATEKNLGFIPLFEERYDLVLPESELERVAPLIDHLQTSAFRRSLTTLTGYNSAHSGEQVTLTDRAK